MNKKYIFFIAIIIFTLFVCSIEYVVRSYEKVQLNEVYLKAESQLSSKAVALQSNIDLNFSLMTGIEAYVASHYLHGTSDDNIQNYLSMMYCGLKSTALNLVIAPQGIMTYIYPLKGNENIVNWNLLKDPREDIQKQLKRGFQTKKMTVDGPFQLIQGNNGLVARKIIYRDNKFWGFVSVALDVDRILKQSNIVNNRDQAINVAIRTSGKSAFFGNNQYFLGKHLQSIIYLPEGTWELAAVPLDDNLKAVHFQMWLMRGLSFLVLLLVFMGFCNLLNQREKLRIQVKKRTEELLVANDELSATNEELIAGEDKLREQYLVLNRYTNALQSSEQQLAYMAYNDVLTGIANRAGFQLELQKLLDFNPNEPIRIAVLFIDLDRFKMVNDTLGHEAGDRLLKGVAERINHAQLPMHFFARYGGDEFAILVLENEQQDRAKVVAERIIELFQKPIMIIDKEYFAAPSIGIARANSGIMLMKELLKRADIAMYEIKKEGGNNYRIYRERMEDTSSAKLELSNELRQALHRNEFCLQYQPQVDCQSGEIVGIEALLRWHHPTKGGISPAAFIPLAEEIGIISSIGEWVLRTACIQMKAWQEEGLRHVNLSVNLSVKQLQDENLVEKVNGILLETGSSKIFGT